MNTKHACSFDIQFSLEDVRKQYEIGVECDREYLRRASLDKSQTVMSRGKFA